MSDHVYVEELIDDVGDHFGAYCNGHVDKEQFCVAYNSEFDGDINPESVEHILARKVPNMRGNFCEGWKMHEVSKPGRGVFKATLYRA